MAFLNKISAIFGNSDEKTLKKLMPVVTEINRHEPEFQLKSDVELLAYSMNLKSKVLAGASLDAILPNAFALVREASVRVLGQRHFDVQLIGGIVLHQGKIAEMRTGEGKTLVSTLPAYLNALNSKGVHVVTVNDYLALRDAQWMGAIYDFLGISVAALQHDKAFLYDSLNRDKNNNPLREIQRNEAYEADITYGTNNEFGFDYLRDNMVSKFDDKVQKKLPYAIVDEVDNILIDEARTPLIISGPSRQNPNEYLQFSRIPSLLVKEYDYSIEEKHKTISLTEKGISKIENALHINNLYDPENYSQVHFVENALRAEVFFVKDKEYVVNNGEVVIVDEFTGRLMVGRRYSDGLHQAIEAKEKVKVQRESITYATITLQNYFRLYSKLSGMTGTASTEAEEFWKIYNLEVVSIPTNNIIRRIDSTDVIYRDQKAKYEAVVQDIIKRIAMGQPVLVGTTDIDKSEQISQMLKAKNVNHEVLNAKQHDREALIIAQAGRPGAVTVATNMAGRGTDIVLGGNNSISEIDNFDWEMNHKKVIDAGGLCIIGTERHESRRIDNQLRGRAGRQGDPGETKFFCALDDDLVRRFGGDRIQSIMDWAGMDQELSIENKMISRSIENAQVKVEAQHFDSRKHLVDYDDVVNSHRNIIYAQRNLILNPTPINSSITLKSQILEIIISEISEIIDDCLIGPDRGMWAIEDMLTDFARIFPIEGDIFNPEYITDNDSDFYKQKVNDYLVSLYEITEQTLGLERCRQLEQILMMRVIDSNWIQHLTTMDNLRQGIGLEAVGQRDPLVMYKKQGFEIFENLQKRISTDTAYIVLKTIINEVSATATRTNDRNVKPVMDQAVSIGKQTTKINTNNKIGRNDKCPCGSGNKYKKCCGVLV
jgi:preprotein translocase subunit SecA